MRFKVRMFMQLQYATNFGVLHVGAGAWRVFDDVTDDFGTLKIKGYTAAMTRAKRDWYSQQSSSRVCQAVSVKRSSKPMSGCWLCPSPDHYAYDRDKHPRLPDGSRKKVSDEDKKAILKRIRSSSFSDEDRKDEEKKCKAYWLQHSL